MMKFAVILKAACINPDFFPKLSQIPINLYDGKDRLDPSDNAEYAENIFLHNTDSLEDFRKFIGSLENQPITHMNVKIDEFRVILFYKTSLYERSFYRVPKNDPIDFMG